MSPANPTVFIMGLRRSGKSSIRKVVFYDMQPLDTLYIESTSTTTSVQLESFTDITFQELPGQLNMFEPTPETDRLFQEVDALIYVIDAQDEYLHALANLQGILEYVAEHRPGLQVEVFIHKVDGLSDDFRLDTRRDIEQRVNDELIDADIENQVSLSFHLTSIFDHSIYEALSLVIQKLTPELPQLENMLNLLCQHSGIDKAFLFDVRSKMYLATDSSPVDIQTYEVCSDFIDVAVDLDNLYDSSGPEAGRPMLCTSILNNGVVLYLRQMIRGLSLVYLMRRESAQKLALVEYNTDLVAEGLEKLYAAKRKSRIPAAS
ncbi:hypothetical protein CANCADRAFT_106914 [Tortispora caseinolytica NRRL Y-17796]|uniref:GTP-binding protein n=1 Tax=Tortispora caseinolytica NRRL Y-17796 TaxID=767744 RepID=A0A1E4TFD2_9ASCO|nr:hypothetical protein CANCADRAFT_106914 [Tortispora caseinolytica NRRL Y-17796]